VLLCWQFCANHATSTALHMQIETPFSVYTCAGLTWTKAALESENNSHESKIVSNHEFHLDTETSKYSYYNITINHLPTVWWLLTNPFLWWLMDILWLWCNHSNVIVYNYYYEYAACIGWRLFNAANSSEVSLYLSSIAAPQIGVHSPVPDRKM